MATVQRIDDGGAKRREEGSKRRPVSAEILDRRPPCNIEAEKGVLGSILLLPDVCDEVALIVRPTDFYDEANQKLFAHIQAIHDAGRRVDLTLLVERLNSSGDFELIGGAGYLAEVARSVPHAANAGHYAQIVRDKATLRSLIHSSTDILRDAYDETTDARDMLNRAEERIFSILGSQGTGRTETISDILHKAMDRIDARMSNQHMQGGIETGFRELDSLTGGLHDSELIILAGRPSMGKTAFALNIAENVAIDLGIPALFVSLEMSSLELADRLLCSRAHVDSRPLRNGHISQDDRRKLVEKAGEISQAPLFVDDSPSRNMTEIAATARRLKRKQKLGLVVIDYLQLIDADNPKDQRQEQVARIARRLKGMARELGIPVLCLAQLNRQAEVAKENRPRLSHLRESGAIEQDADLVMFVHRDEYYETNEDDRAAKAGQADIVVAKQRNGPTGEVKLTWLSKYTRFEDSARPHHSEFGDYA
jgi:replicative DNA helicase